MTRRRLLLGAIFAVGCAGGATVCVRRTPPQPSAPAFAVAAVDAPPIVPRAYEKRAELPSWLVRPTPPGLDAARGWLNVKRPPKAEDLRGRVVVLDFWTSCCINCMHTLPILARLEKKHARDPFLVIGVHTQKFDAEPEPRRLRASVIRYGIEHPVAIDGDRGIWEAFGISAWPTVVVLDSKGRVIFEEGGEPNEAELDAIIESALAEGAEDGSLAKSPPDFLGREVDDDAPLSFPEKVAKVPGGFAVADSGHDRIVLIDDAGTVTDLVGGGRGFVDGDFETARFAHPQGIVAEGDLLFVADTENHAIRQIDRKAKRVTTLAGTGALGGGRMAFDPVPARTPLRSPWDLAIVSGRLYVAMAGSHQIALLDRGAQTIRAFAGTGQEHRSDGTLKTATFAQPSGLATDGRDLFVLDSETSSIRRIDLAAGEVETLVGEALFVWGDRDGEGSKVRLQHPIGLAFGDGALFVADTYNGKVKRVDPKNGATKTIAAGFSEPAGLAFAGPGSLLVADTNANRLVRLTTAGSIAPLPLAGLAKPPR
jgi:thiol-disulfide isomerase/thioredoxin